MKPLNNMKFIHEASVSHAENLERISSASTFDEARSRGNAALGFVKCLIVYLNCMVCKENNDFTAEVDEMIDSMNYQIFQRMIDKAIETKQDNNTVLYLIRMRNGYTD